VPTVSVASEATNVPMSSVLTVQQRIAEAAVDDEVEDGDPGEAYQRPRWSRHRTRPSRRVSARGAPVSRIRDRGIAAAVRARLRCEMQASCTGVKELVSARGRPGPWPVPVRREEVLRFVSSTHRPPARQRPG